MASKVLFYVGLLYLREQLPDITNVQQQTDLYTIRVHVNAQIMQSKLIKHEKFATIKQLRTGFKDVVFDRHIPNVISSFDRGSVSVCSATCADHVAGVILSVPSCSQRVFYANRR